VRRLRDPALLEFAGYNLIRSSVFPVPAHGTQKVRLTYHHLLPVVGGRVDYILPRSESLEVEAPWEVDVDIQAKAPIATVYSPSHEVLTKRDTPRHVTVRARDGAGRAPGPFRLSYLLQHDGVAASLFAYPDPKIGGGYFLLLAGLPPHVKEATRVKREVTLVIDRSGSMAGPKLDQVRAAALQVIEGLADGEAFNVIDYSTTVAMMAPAPVVKSRETVLKARTYLANLRPMGGTNIHDALVEALRQESSEGMLPIVLFLTDGLPTIGQTSEVAIRELAEKGNPRGRRVFTFGVGHDVNAPLLDRIADTTRAAPTYVLPDEDVELRVAQVFQRLYGPVLAAPKLETVGADGAVVTDVVREVIPATLPDLFEGDQLVLLGQYRGEGPLRFRLQGEYLGAPRTFSLEFGVDQATTHNAFVPRLWASRRIAFLVDQLRQAGASQPGRPARVGETLLKDPRYRELVDEIVRLSTEFGILSEYTAFLAKEGTDLSDWLMLNDRAGDEIDRKAVNRRWGKEAVARAQQVEQGKKQKVLTFNSYTDAVKGLVEIPNVQHCNDRALFKRGKQWIDGSLIANRITLKADQVVKFGTPEFAALLELLVKQNRQGALAVRGDILIRVNDKTVLVKNEWEERQSKK
jgi:Ca-activated chloride channel family protein